MTDQARHLARIASALERIAVQFEKGGDELDVMKGAEEADVEARERELERIRRQVEPLHKRKPVRKNDPILPRPAWMSE